MSEPLDAAAFAHYKAQKEAFVSNHTGTSLFEITALICVFPVALWVSSVFSSLLTIHLRNGQAFPDWIQVLFTFVTVVLPLVGAFTMPEHLPMLYTLLLSLGASFGLLFSNTSNSSKCIVIRSEISSGSRARSRSRTRMQTEVPSDDSSFRVNNSNGVAWEVSEFRACTMLATCIAILAVDFQVFPRRFAKCETFGTGLMDVGTGCFVLCNAFVSRCARGTPRPPDVEMKAVLKSTCPILAIGLLRLAAVKGAEYQEHVSEYGVHWNFFFTIAFLRLSVVLLHYVLPSTQHPPTAAAFGAAVLIAYNYALSHSGLSTWIQTAPRTTLVQQNREGLCSLAGYLGLYLVGVLVGWLQSIPSARNGNGSYKSQVVWLTTAALWAMTLYTKSLFPISRRFANLSYAIWILALSSLVLALLMTLRQVTPTMQLSSLANAADKRPRRLNKLVELVDSNLLVVFLVANLLTGAVNLSMKTLFATDMEAVGIISGYMLLVCMAPLLYSSVRPKQIRQET